MVTFDAKKRTAAEKAYLSALCRVLVLLQFRASDQGPVKLMRRLLNRLSISLAAEKDLMKELRQMAERLRSIDEHPDEILSTEESYLILGNYLAVLFYICLVLSNFLTYLVNMDGPSPHSSFEQYKLYVLNIRGLACDLMS